MRKYWLLFKMQLEYVFIYRSTGLIWFLADVGSHWVFILFWLAAYQGQSLIAGYTLTSMILYYFGAMFISAIVEPHPHYWLSETIRDGSFSPFFLLRPLSVFGERIVSQVSWRLERLIFMLPATWLLWLWLRPHLSGLEFSGKQLILLMASLMLAFVGHLLLKICLGLATMWFEEVGWLFTFWELLMVVFGGYFFPLDLLPHALQAISQWLPFRYFFYFPLSIFLGKLAPAEIYQGIGLQLVWLVIGYGLYRLVLTKGIKNYSAYGS